jgi:hypothetical protein
MNWSEQHPAIIQGDMIISCNNQKLSEELLRPCNIKKPVVSQDGNMFCALLGENLQEGISGWGKSPELACLDFDKEWNKEIP